MKTFMKEDELRILRGVARNLGANSYCGPWLESILPCIEDDMRSDMPPFPSVVDLRAEQDRLRQVAEQLSARERELRTWQEGLTSRERALEFERESLKRELDSALSRLEQAVSVIERATKRA